MFPADVEALRVNRGDRDIGGMRFGECRRERGRGNCGNFHGFLIGLARVDQPARRPR